MSSSTSSDYMRMPASKKNISAGLGLLLIVAVTSLIVTYTQLPLGGDAGSCLLQETPTINRNLSLVSFGNETSNADLLDALEHSCISTSKEFEELRGKVPSQGQDVLPVVAALLNKLREFEAQYVE